MLIPAVLRKDEIIREYMKKQYTDDLMYGLGTYDNYIPNIVDEPNKETFQFAIINTKDELIGYVSYRIDWYSSQAYNFGLMSFDKGNPLIGREVFNIMNNIINNLKLHRVEWRMVGGNPVERSYDKLCKMYNGKKIILKDTFKDKMGNYRDSIIYEIIQDTNK